MKNIEKYILESYIANLIGLPLAYIQKIQGTELYGFGFGKVKAGIVTDYTLHVLCPLGLACLRPERKKVFIDFETPLEEFRAAFYPLISKKVCHARITPSNDLRIHFDSAWITTLASYDPPGDYEAWRLFQPNSPNLHLVARQISPGQLSIEFE